MNSMMEMGAVEGLILRAATDGDVMNEFLMLNFFVYFAGALHCTL